jgi:hypothetical protein
MLNRMTCVVVCLLAGLTTASANGQTATVNVNRILDFKTVSAPLGSVTVPGGAAADPRQAWLSIVTANVKTNCTATITITTPASIARTTAPTSVTIPTSPINATLVFPSGTTPASQSIPATGTATAITPKIVAGTYQLYIGTTGDFTAARAGGYAGSINVTFVLGSKC